MKILFLTFLGYATAYEGSANRYDLGGKCWFESNQTQARVAVPKSLYLNGDGCGTCIEVEVNNTISNKVTIARITDECNDCSDSQILLGETAFHQLNKSTENNIQLTWKATTCPYTNPSILWHKHSQAYWARFKISNFPDNIKNVSVLTPDYAPLKPNTWDEYDAPKNSSSLVLSKFNIEVVGRSSFKKRYSVEFPYQNSSPPQGTDPNNSYPGPSLPLVELTDNRC